MVQTEHLASEVMAAVSAGVREGTAMTRTKCHTIDWKHKIHSKKHRVCTQKDT